MKIHTNFLIMLAILIGSVAVVLWILKIAGVIGFVAPMIALLLQYALLFICQRRFRKS